jgi:hypothetical protein
MVMNVVCLIFKASNVSLLENIAMLPLQNFVVVFYVFFLAI